MAGLTSISSNELVITLEPSVEVLAPFSQVFVSPVRTMKTSIQHLFMIFNRFWTSLTEGQCNVMIHRFLVQQRTYKRNFFENNTTGYADITFGEAVRFIYFKFYCF